MSHNPVKCMGPSPFNVLMLRFIAKNFGAANGTYLRKTEWISSKKYNISSMAYASRRAYNSPCWCLAIWIRIHYDRHVCKAVLFDGPLFYISFGRSHTWIVKARILWEGHKTLRLIFKVYRMHIWTIITRKH